MVPPSAEIKGLPFICAKSDRFAGTKRGPFCQDPFISPGGGGRMQRDRRWMPAPS